MGYDNLEPYILISDRETNLKASLVVDKRVIDDIEDMNDLPFVLMSAFFVYNIFYPKGCNNFYSMLEVLVLNYNSDKLSPTARNLLPKILC